MVGHIEHRSALGEFQQVALRREDVNLVLVEVHLELVHRLAPFARLQHLADGGEPLVHTALPFDALIAPVGGNAALGHLVHTLRANLNLDPLLLRAEHGDVKTLVAVGLRHRQPVAQTLRVGLIHIGHNTVCLPALLLLDVLGTVDDDADGKQVVDALKAAFLLLHLLPDGVYRLGAPLDVKRQASPCQLVADRLYEALDIAVTTLLRLGELVLDEVVGVVLQVLEREVLQFGFQLVETQFMSQRRIQVGRLLAHLTAQLVVRRVAYLPHQVHAVGNHDEYHAHILSKRQQQVAEVLALNNGILLVELLDAAQTMQDARNGLAVVALHIVDGQQSRLHTVAQQDGHNGVALQACLVDKDASRLQFRQHRIQAEGVANNLFLLHQLPYMPPQPLLVVGRQRVAYLLLQPAI